MRREIANLRDGVKRILRFIYWRSDGQKRQKQREESS